MVLVDAGRREWRRARMRAWRRAADAVASAAQAQRKRSASASQAQRKRSARAAQAQGTRIASATQAERKRSASATQAQRKRSASPAQAMREQCASAAQAQHAKGNFSYFRISHFFSPSLSRFLLFSTSVTQQSIQAAGSGATFRIS